VASELLRRANELVKGKIHPTTVIAGFRLAMRESIKYIKENLTVSVDTLGREALLNTVTTTLQSKLIGSDAESFSNKIVSAVEAVKVTNNRGEARYPIKAINLLKIHGSSAHESEHVNGYVLPMGRSAQGMPTYVENAKIACLDFNLNKFKL